MPYIEQARRDSIMSGDGQPETAGELNFCLTLICKEYFGRMGGRYQQINDILGALEGAKLEFYRRVASPYEDEKADQNGDVY